ncbi:MAG: ROK family protein [Pseudobdellovibrionaceae bacterium]
MKVLSFDIGGTKIAAAVIGEQGQFFSEKKIATPIQSWPEARQALVELGKGILAEHPEIKACGISSAGPLHAASGRLLFPTNMMAWGEVDLTRELQTEFGIPVQLENDAAAAVIGEHWLGEFKNSSSLLMITLGTGLGVGLMVDHELSRGGRGFHPEGGHLLLQLGDDSALCACGNFGCAEAYLAGSHFLRRARLRFQDPGLTPETLIEKAKTQDPLAMELFENYSLRLAQFIFNYMMLSYPYAVVLGGSFAQSSAYFLPRTFSHLDRFLEKRPSDWMPKISVSQLNNAGLLGAAKLAFKQLGQPSQIK